MTDWTPTGSDDALFPILDKAWIDGGELGRLDKNALYAWRDAAVARHLAEAGAVHQAVHTPNRVQNWLERHGWQMYSVTDLASLWAHPNWPGPRGWSLTLPLLVDSVDYARGVIALVQHAAMVGGVEAEQALLEIALLPDEVAW